MVAWSVYDLVTEALFSPGINNVICNLISSRITIT